MLYNYDYTQTIWMKMFMARPDFPNNRSVVLINYEQAMEIVKKIDAVTQGIKKIIYLVGWQGLGHDDCYPEMKKMNEALKRDCDTCAHDSYMWLYEESKKYNTVISVHGNLADCYGENESFPEMLKGNGVAQNPDGSPAVIEIFNGRPAYKTSYADYLNCGLFRKQWQEFMDTLPVKEAGTVHLDNFCLVENLYSGQLLNEQVEARDKMLDYITDECGIDITTEYTYREKPLRTDDGGHPIHKYYGNEETKVQKNTKPGPIHCLGKIAASWWQSNMTEQDLISIPPAVYSGHLTDTAYRRVYYGAIHGEDIWTKNGTDAEKWVPEFIKQFCLEQVPYSYLCRHTRVALDKAEDDDGDDRYTGYFSDDIVSGRGMIFSKGKQVKDEGDVILPINKECTKFVAYSEEGRNGAWNVPEAKFTEAKLYEITENGNVFVKDIMVENGTVSLDIPAGKAFAIEGK